MIIFSFVAWNLLWIVLVYLPFPLPTTKTLTDFELLDSKNRIISIVHGLILVTFSCYHYYMMPGSCGELNSQYEKNLLYTAVGYFLYDFTAMAYYGLLDKTMTIHHWICIIGMSLPLTYNMSANYVVMGMFVAETSNPFMHARCIIRNYGLRYTKIYEFMEISFMLFYIYCRIFLGIGLTFNNCLCQYNSIIVRGCSLCLLF